MDPIPVPVEHHVWYLGSVIVHYYVEHIVFDMLDNFETNLMPFREHHKFKFV